MVRVLAWLVLVVQKREGLAGGLRGTRLRLFGRTRGGLRRLQSRLLDCGISLRTAHRFGSLLHCPDEYALSLFLTDQVEVLAELRLFVVGEGEDTFQNVARELNDGLAARNFVRSGRSCGRFR